MIGNKGTTDALGFIKPVEAQDLALCQVFTRISRMLLCYT